MTATGNKAGMSGNLGSSTRLDGVYATLIADYEVLNNQPVRGYPVRARRAT